MSERHATLYDFRDLDLMMHLAERANGTGVPTAELADLLGFDEGDNRPVGIRMAWMRRYGMVAFDDKERSWRLTPGGERVTKAHLLAPELKIVDSMPDEAAVELMAHVTSRYQRGEPMIAAMLKREFMFGTKRR
jgi:hypothetical protein